MIGVKPLLILFNKVDGFIGDYDRTKYLILFDPEKYAATYDRIRYHLGLKSGITYTASQNYAKININLGDDFPLQKNIDFV